MPPLGCTRNWSSPLRQQLPEATALASAAAAAADWPDSSGECEESESESERAGAREETAKEALLLVSSSLLSTASLLYTFALADCLIRRTDRTLVLFPRFSLCFRSDFVRLLRLKGYRKLPRRGRFIDKLQESATRFL